VNVKIAVAAAGIAAAWIVVLAILIAVFSHPSQAPAPAVPAICTPAGATALNNYWQNQIDSASAANVQSVIAQATEATRKALNYCESIAG
jgi:membrane-bound ClpP family serine protease